MNDQLKSIQKYMKSEPIVSRFEEIVGKTQAMAYITSVLLVVANSDALQRCSSESIFTSAIRAATLRLSCDPATKQAYLVPFKGKCTLIVGYKGLYDMAVRTNKYRYINIGPIYEGEEVLEDRITGFHRMSGAKTGSEIKGYIGAFELYQGYAKTFYMTVQEIHAHAQKYSKSYSYPDSPWQTATEQMERKTVLRRMLDQWGYMDPIDAHFLHSIDENGIDIPEIVDVEPQEANGNGHRTPEEIMNDLGFDTADEAARGTPPPPEVPPSDAEIDTDLGYEQFEGEQEDGNDPYSDLDFQAESDPSTAFWLLQKRLKYSKEDADAIVKECKQDMNAAYKALRKQAPPVEVAGD